MKLNLIVSGLLALEVDSKFIRGAKIRKRQGVDKALRRCYPVFLEYEECLMSAYYQYDCDDLRNDYFECMDEDSDSNANCDSSYFMSTSQTVERNNLSNFGTELFTQLCLANPRSNILVSPLSGKFWQILALIDEVHHLITGIFNISIPGFGDVRRWRNCKQQM